MSTPIYDFRPERMDKPKRPLIMFAGEATTPYHPSTIHGAFESGIREAYRLDLALEPTLTGGITFDESFLYKPTFSVRRGQADPTSFSYKAPETVATRNSAKNDASANEWWFDHDASILRGVETFGFSTQSMLTIKAKMLAPFSNTHCVEEMEGRYKSLMQMVGAYDATTSKTNAGNDWDIQGQRGQRESWLAANVQDSRPNSVKAEQDNGQFASKVGVGNDVQARRSSRNSRKITDASFTFY
jgi:hypothetical protein